MWALIRGFQDSEASWPQGLFFFWGGHTVCAVGLLGLVTVLWVQGFGIELSGLFRVVWSLLKGRGRHLVVGIVLQLRTPL